MFRRTQNFLKIIFLICLFALSGCQEWQWTVSNIRLHSSEHEGQYGSINQLYVRLYSAASNTDYQSSIDRARLFYHKKASHDDEQELLANFYEKGQYSDFMNFAGNRIFTAITNKPYMLLYEFWHLLADEDLQYLLYSVYLFAYFFL